MPGFTTSDGAEIAGAKNPGGVGQALQVDSGGNLKVTATGLGGIPVAVDANGFVQIQIVGQNDTNVAGVDTSNRLQTIISSALPAGANTIGNVGTVPITSGGLADFHLISAATTNETNIKATAGQVYSYDIYNSNAAVRFVKLYNTAGAPTAGSGTPLRTIAVPPGGRACYSSAHGIAFSTGIGLTTVTGMADNNAAAVGANDLSIEIDYK